MNDLLVPYKPQSTVFKKKPIYTRCMLPKNRDEGNVVFASMQMEAERWIIGPGEYVTIDLGKALVTNGDFLLFYILLKKDLPPLIVGTGIVLDSQNTNSTVKILDAAYPIEIGTKFLVLKENDLKIETTRKSKMRRLIGEEKIPIIEKLDKEGEEAAGGVLAGDETLELNVLFDLNENTINDEYKADLEKIGEFLQGKSQFVIILRGYACSIGNPEYNLKLSKERVDNIKKHLMDRFNIKEDFFETYYYGEKESLYDNTSEEERRKNRLVTVQVLGK
jgi:outer membrane protein OmpA-like peptidoglycan-associated protein